MTKESRSELAGKTSLSRHAQSIAYIQFLKISRNPRQELSKLNGKAKNSVYSTSPPRKVEAGARLRGEKARAALTNLRPRFTNGKADE